MSVGVQFGKNCGCVASGLRGLFIVATLLFGFKKNDLYSQVRAPAFSRNNSDVTTVDTGYMRVWYAFNAEDVNKQETFEDFHRLEIGAFLSKYYSDFVYRNDSLCDVWSRENPRAQSAPRRCLSMGFHVRNQWSEYYFTHFFKDFSQGLITQYSLMPRLTPHFQYSENIPVQDWTVLNDTLTVAGYLCQKAICRFRGRDFVAWFTPDIPVNNGPWKFGGLPGLILKVYDTEKQYVFECTQIRLVTFPIEKHDPMLYAETSRDNFRRAVARIYDGTNNPWANDVVWNPIELE